LELSELYGQFRECIPVHLMRLQGKGRDLPPEICRPSIHLRRQARHGAVGGASNIASWRTIREPILRRKSTTFIPPHLEYSPPRLGRTRWLASAGFESGLAAHWWNVAVRARGRQPPFDICPARRSCRTCVASCLTESVPSCWV
jgi:hypothetical protein